MHPYYLQTYLISMCTLVATSMILGRLECVFDGFMWSSEDQRTNTVKHMCLKEIGLHLQGYINYSMFKLNTIARPTCLIKESTNMHFR